MIEVAPLMKRIAELKQDGLTGIWVARHFLKYRLNPLKERVHPAFEYTGHHDPTRESEVDLAEEEVGNRLRALFADGVDIPTKKNKPWCRSFHIYRPPPQVCIFINIVLSLGADLSTSIGHPLRYDFSNR